MSGSIGYNKKSKIYFVQWWDKKKKKQVKIYRYKGEVLYHEKFAKKLLSVMQSRVEDGIFRIDEFTGKKLSNFHEWLDRRAKIGLKWLFVNRAF